MPRDRTFGRHAKHSNGRKPAPMICGVSNCQLGCWTKTYGGEMVTSEYCEKHSCEPRPELGVCLGRKRSKDAFCHEHSTCQFSNCKKPIDSQYGPSSSCCPYHKCRIQDCPHPVADTYVPFCSHHDGKIHYDWHYVHTLRSSLDYTPPPSPPRPAAQEKPADSSRSPEERPPAPIVAAAATTGMSDRPCACARNATPDESKPAPIARLVEPQMEPKVEDANPVAEEVQGGGRGEKETLPTFFSGVAVGLCILMQMLYVILQLLLEMARGTAKWTM